MVFFSKKKSDKNIVTIGPTGRVAFIVKSGATLGPHQFGLSVDGIEIIKALRFKVFAVINYTDIKDIQIELKENVIEKNKSVIGRAIIGGVLTGGIGAVVGGISGVGTNKVA